jgi:hypothetical protein
MDASSSVEDQRWDFVALPPNSRTITINAANVKLDDKAVPALALISTLTALGLAQAVCEQAT